MSNSYIKNNSEIGKKTALKLLNKYADSFNNIKEENKLLKSQIEDLRSNLKINKSIIESFFSKLAPKDKEKSILSIIKTENENLFKQNEELRKKNDELNSKINVSEQTHADILSQTKEENESLKTKNFVLEQTLLKKDNIINHQKCRLNLVKNNYNCTPSEIYVTNPNKLINQMNDQLCTYKELSEKKAVILQETRTILEKYEKQLVDLQNENQLLRQEYKSHIFNTNKERETLMTTIQKERTQLRSYTEDNAFDRRSKYNESKEKKENSSTKESIKDNNSKKSKRKNNNKKKLSNENSPKKEKNENNERNYSICNTHGTYLSTDPNRLKTSTSGKHKNFIYGKGPMQVYRDNYFLSEIESKQYEHEDFIEIIKSVGLSLEKYEELTQMKTYSKFTEIIEMLLNLIKEKEQIINILQNENDNLTAANYKTNKDNMFLFNQNLNLKDQINKLTLGNSNKKQKSLCNFPIDKKEKSYDLDPKIKQAIKNYREYLNVNQKESKTPTDNLLDINRVIIETSVEMESTLKEKTLKKRNENLNKDVLQSNKSNGIAKNEDNNKKHKNKNNDNFLVKPILEKNDELKMLKVNENLTGGEKLELKIDGNKNNGDECDNNTNNKKINYINKNNTLNKYAGTLVSITSSEFRDGCPGVDSFLSTMKFDETKKMNGNKQSFLNQQQINSNINANEKIIYSNNNNMKNKPVSGE